MTVNIGINGFGRIGRGYFRAAMRNQKFREKCNIVAVNDVTAAETLAYLLKYDSVFGRYPGTVQAKDNSLIVDGKTILVFSEKDPSKLPWSKLDVSIVLESTGIFRNRQESRKHLDAGAKKVIVSAPSDDLDCTIVMGVNDETYDPNRHHLISMASCTTGCLAPIVKVLNEKFGIESGFMTTCHAYTNDQRLLDLPHKDARRGRAAGASIIPTSTGAASAIGQVIPEMAGKLDGLSLRVPIPNGSINDTVFTLSKEVTAKEVNDALRQAAEGELKGILDYTEDPLVSADIIGQSASSIVDGLSTRVIGGKGRLVKVLSWYDNEWGFSNRLVDLTLKVADGL